ncbi:ibr finger domain-containing protein [Fusarium coicis]|nr:ibr finger domain-containing protein [Fusarium coicis]
MDEHGDYAIALSIAQAVEADAELIAALIREDGQARRDHEFAMQLEEDSDATPETDDDGDYIGLDDETYYTLHFFNVAVQPTENTEVEMELSNEEDHDDMSFGEEDETERGSNSDEDFEGDADNQSDRTAVQEDFSYMDEDETQENDIRTDGTQPENAQEERDADEHPGIASIRTAMKDESIFPPKCCSQAIPMDTTNVFITEEMLAEYDDKREEFATTKRTYCSDRTCSAFIPTRSIDDGIGRCTRCEKWTCLNCLSEAHEGACTDDAESQRVIRLAEEKGWRRCEQCKNMVELDHGCFHISTNSAIAAACGGKPVTALSGTRNNSWRGEQQHNASPVHAVTESTFGLTACGVQDSAMNVRNGHGISFCVVKIVASSFAFHVS